MYTLYSLLVRLVELLLPLVARNSVKLQQFVSGRANVFAQLSDFMRLKPQTIWFHTASLGEYEQGLPIIEEVKKQYPNHKIVLTFFSPSGYEIRKNNKIADLTLYLPLDTAANARKFLNLLNPELVFFVKYEYWPNYLREMKRSNTKLFLVSGVFRSNQIFFKWYGGFYRKALTAFTHFFVQNTTAAELLRSIGFQNISVSGDTRFDRVATIATHVETPEWLTNFKGTDNLIVIGSSWPKDEQLWANYINSSAAGTKFLFAPHNIKAVQITELQQQLRVPFSTFSTMKLDELPATRVLIVDAIGFLTSLYAAADIAYVGGGFGNPGVHNVLEPAVFGTPVVVGPNYSHFAEATALVKNGGVLSVDSEMALRDKIDLLLNEPDVAAEVGHIAQTFVQMNTGATASVMKYLGNL